MSLEALIELQEVDGSWMPSNKLESLLSTVLKKTQLVPPSPFEPKLTAASRKRAWMTTVVLWVLEKHFGEKKGEWKRIAIKAGNFLKKEGVTNKDISALL